MSPSRSARTNEFNLPETWIYVSKSNIDNHHFFDFSLTTRNHVGEDYMLQLHSYLYDGELEAGDTIMYIYKKSNGHICMITGYNAIQYRLNKTSIPPQYAVDIAIVSENTSFGSSIETLLNEGEPRYKRKISAVADAETATFVKRIHT